MAVIFSLFLCTSSPYTRLPGLAEAREEKDTKSEQEKKPLPNAGKGCQGNLAAPPPAIKYVLFRLAKRVKQTRRRPSVRDRERAELSRMHMNLYGTYLSDSEDDDDNGSGFSNDVSLEEVFYDVQVTLVGAEQAWARGHNATVSCLTIASLCRQFFFAACPPPAALTRVHPSDYRRGALQRWRGLQRRPH